MTYCEQIDDGRVLSGSMTLPSSSPKVLEMEKSQKNQALPANLSRTSPLVHLSKSMPSTPSQRSQSRSDQRRSPSLSRTTNNVSPHSLTSDSSQTPPASRKPVGGCKYETAMARARRRVPYSLGPEKLEPESSALPTNLRAEDESKLTKDMQALYERLIPSVEGEERRAKFVQKLEKILRGRWPGFMINAAVFGSTGNNLGTSDSDVDICITTDCKELERVCSIADLLAKHGMERVVCVSSAKVPIVKVWDPELQVACDLNVNNPMALENTALVRSYVAIDPRVRPLAMIIKHWAKRRILNDAALGGTLSSYTWICLALNFLQTRNPPILPSLQQSDRAEPRYLGGVNVAFDQNLEAYQNFGSHNKSSLGELLFQFFRYYGHELDFEKNAMSVRLGKVLPKTEKAWHLLQDNRLCVEEPFNTSRNLANTADDTSMRGIHLELRRAFHLISRAKMDDCCEQFTYPPEEIKSSEHFIPPVPRPLVAQAPTQPSRGGRNVSRGSRQANHMNRGTPGRRSSNPAGRTPVYLRNLPFQMTTQELQLQAQHQQRLLHDQLFQQYQYLQQQEQELRMQLHQQNLRQRGIISSATYQPTSFGTYMSQDDDSDRGSNAPFESLNRTPLSAPLYQHRFPSSSPYLGAAIPNQGVITNPSSPHLMPAIPDARRFSRRTSVNQSAAGGSLRAHSQPARSVPVPLVLGNLPRNAEYINGTDQMMARRSSASSASQENSAAYMQHHFGIAAPFYDPARRPAEYVGYYVGQSPSLMGYSSSGAISPLPSHAGLAIQNGGLSPHLSSSALASLGAASANRYAQTTRSSADGETVSAKMTGSETASNNQEDSVTPPRRRPGPLIVDGSLKSPARRRPNGNTRQEVDESLNMSTSTSEDLAFDTPSSSDEQSQGPLDHPSVLGYDSPSGAIEDVIHAARSNGPIHAPRNDLNQHFVKTSASVGTPSAYQETNGIHNPSTVVVTNQGVPTPWKLGSQLSSVEEVTVPSPTKAHHGSGLGDSQGEVDTPKGDSRNGIGPHEDFKLLRSDASSHDTNPLSTRPNGATGTHPTAMNMGAAAPASGWQTQKKKKKGKKLSKSENELQSFNPAGGDFLPRDESLRKGG